MQKRIFTIAALVAACTTAASFAQQQNPGANEEGNNPDRLGDALRRGGFLSERAGTDSGTVYGPNVPQQPGRDTDAERSSGQGADRGTAASGGSGNSGSTGAPGGDGSGPLSYDKNPKPSTIYGPNVPQHPQHPQQKQDRDRGGQ